jgi:hypothetical protein
MIHVSTVHPAACKILGKKQRAASKVFVPSCCKLDWLLDPARGNWAAVDEGRLQQVLLLLLLLLLLWLSQRGILASQ